MKITDKELDNVVQTRKFLDKTIKIVHLDGGSSSDFDTFRVYLDDYRKSSTKRYKDSYSMNGFAKELIDFHMLEMTVKGE